MTMKRVMQPASGEIDDNAMTCVTRVAGSARKQGATRIRLGLGRPHLRMSDGLRWLAVKDGAVPSALTSSKQHGLISAA
ncbi:MAG TPA: hypothetical protein VFQ87_15190, partial [Bradyrhizobium sp.]|nr:hypothetical protein [Bradyrhizobium sp.]